MGAVESLGALCPAIGLPLGGGLVGAQLAAGGVPRRRARRGREHGRFCACLWVGLSRAEPATPAATDEEPSRCHEHHRGLRVMARHLKYHAGSAVKYDRIRRRHDRRRTADETTLLGRRGACCSSARSAPPPWLASAQEWQPLPLVGLLLALALLGQRLSVRDPRAAPDGLIRRAGARDEPARPGAGGGCSGSLAAAICISASATLPLSSWLNNLSTFAVFPLVGGLMVRALVGDVHDPSQLRPRAERHVRAGRLRGVHGHQRAQLRDGRARRPRDRGRTLLGQVRDLFVPLLPGQIATGVLAAILAVAYTNLGSAGAVRRRCSCC